jgi:O-antigen/teichoic acid export membrane protein
MMTYGFGYSCATWIWCIRTLVNPIIVARFLGAEAVAFVSVAIKLIGVFSFVRNIVLRISMPALARLQNNRTKLLEAVSEGSNLQLMALGAILAAFIWVSPWVIPLVYGDRWLPVLHILPFIALGVMTNSFFGLQISALYVIRRNWKVAQAALVYVIFFAGSVFFLINRYGLLGYGYSELAAIPAYIIVYLYFKKYIGHISFSKILVNFIPISLSLFPYQLGWWTVLTLIIPILSRDNYNNILLVLKSHKNY